MHNLGRRSPQSLYRSEVMFILNFELQTHFNLKPAMEEDKQEISPTTYQVVMGETGVITENDRLLVANKNNGQLVYINLTPEVMTMFNLERVNAEVKAANDEGSEEDETNPEEDKRLWSRDATLFLIHQVEKNQTKFDNDVKKTVWAKIAVDCSNKFNRVTASQCDTKWKSLKRTYKSVRLHNQTSGKARRHWEYFNLIDQFMNKKPEITPVATCSSMSGLRSSQDCEIAVDTSALSDANRLNIVESSFSRKRKLRVSESTIRHQEKMKRMDRFNDLFEKMIDKL